MSSAYEPITSFQNAKVKQIKKLRDRRERDKTGRFVIDYNRDLERALASGIAVDYVFFCAELAADEDRALLNALPEQSIYAVPRGIMEKCAYRQNPAGLVAVMHQPAALTLDDLGERAGPRVLALVDLRKPGNIGALLRTADAAGFTTILLIDTALDLYNPNIIRSSTGACFLGNIWTLETAAARDFLREAGYSLIAAAVDGDRSLFEVDFSGRAALLLGTEDDGLSDEWLNAADQRARIPMTGGLSDSLNVSVSGAIFMYEALRQSGGG